MISWTLWCWPRWLAYIHVIHGCTFQPWLWQLTKPNLCHQDVISWSHSCQTTHCSCLLPYGFMSSPIESPVKNPISCGTRPFSKSDSSSTVVPAFREGPKRKDVLAQAEPPAIKGTMRSSNAMDWTGQSKETQAGFKNFWNLDFGLIDWLTWKWFGKPTAFNRFFQVWPFVRVAVYVSAELWLELLDFCSKSQLLKIKNQLWRSENSNFGRVKSFFIAYLAHRKAIKFGIHWSQLDLETTFIVVQTLECLWVAFDGCLKSLRHSRLDLEIWHLSTMDERKSQMSKKLSALATMPLSDKSTVKSSSDMPESSHLKHAIDT